MALNQAGSGVWGVNSVTPAGSSPLASALRGPPAAPGWAQPWGQPSSSPPAPGVHAGGTPSEEARRPEARVTLPRRTTPVGPLG